eukprot:713475-Pelagomonas_calceolata.AAC.8
MESMLAHPLLSLEHGRQLLVVIDVALRKSGQGITIEGQLRGHFNVTLRKSEQGITIEGDGGNEYA